MKKTSLLNQPLSAVIAGMGHGDTLVIGDAGLPIPDGPQRIDLAVSQGVPAFLDVVKAVLSELQIEGVIIAQEFAEKSPALHAQLRDLLSSLLGDVPIEAVPHGALKTHTVDAKAVVRTGEYTPYANVILIAGVVF
ncbi:MAG: D-ribose pyranase [Anaerolineae bacterium]|nr:D-ribose pyranase [Anaerolineae bacterium]